MTKTSPQTLTKEEYEGEKANTNAGTKNLIAALDRSEEIKPCGRSYSSAKALKDHIRTVHTDTNIYSCHVSRLFIPNGIFGTECTLLNSNV